MLSRCLTGMLPTLKILAVYIKLKNNQIYQHNFSLLPGERYVIV